MPIDTYTRQVMPREMARTQASAAAFGGDQSGTRAIAGALGDLSGAIGAVEQRLTEVRQKREKVEHYERWTQHQADRAAERAEMSKQDYDPSVDLGQEWRTTEEEALKEFEKGVPDHLKDQFRMDAAQYLAQAQLDGLKEQSGREALRIRTSWENTVQLQANLAAARPGNRAAALNTLRAQVDALPLPAEEREALFEEAKDGVNQAAASAMATNAPGAFLAQAQAGQWNDVPDLVRYQNAARAEIKRETSAAQGRVRTAVVARHKDAIAEASATGATSQAPNIQEYMAAGFTQEEAAAQVASVERAAVFGQTIQQIAMMSPEEELRLLSENRPEGERFAEKAGTLQKYEAEIAAKRKALSADPAGFVVQYSPAAQAALMDADAAVTAYLQDPEGAPNPATYFEAAAEQVQAEQVRLGVPEYDVRVLPIGQAQALVNQFDAARPDERAPLITSLQSAYGKYWPEVEAEMHAAGLPENWGYATQMLSDPTSQKRGEQLATALSMPSKERGALITTDDKRAIEDAVTNNNEMLAFISASLAQKQPESAGTAASAIESAVALATVLVAEEGMSPGNAAREAVNEVVGGKRYLYTSGAKVPAQYASGDDVYVGGYVSIGMENYVSELAVDTTIISSTQPLGPLADVPQDIIDEQYREELAMNGKWVTDYDERFAVLLDGEGRRVTRNDGATIRVPFEQLEKRGVEALYASLQQREAIREEAEESPLGTRRERSASIGIEGILRRNPQLEPLYRQYQETGQWPNMEGAQ
jgi:hypothetical protein